MSRYKFQTPYTLSPYQGLEHSLKNIPRKSHTKQYLPTLFLRAQIKKVISTCNNFFGKYHVNFP
jgi:hypothetical protein